MKLVFIATILLFVFQTLNAQFVVSGYADIYYAVDSDYSQERASNQYRLFSFMDGKKNEFSLNVVNIALDAKHERVYGRISLHYGDLPTQAWFGNYSMIQEAYVGVRISDVSSVDGGYFLTHIGNEVLMPKGNFLVSHSMVTFLEPFYHAGIRTHWQVSDKFKASFLLINSLWNYENINKNFGYGLNLLYGSKDFSVSYAGAISNESQPRIVADLYNNLNFSINSNDVQVRFQADLYTKLGELNNTRATYGLSSSVKIPLKIFENLSGMGRFSYVNNTDGTFINLPFTELYEIAAGLEYKPSKNSYVRWEARSINFSDKMLSPFRDKNGSFMDKRLESLLNIGFWFDSSNPFK